MQIVWSNDLPRVSTSSIRSSQLQVLDVVLIDQCLLSLETGRADIDRIAEEVPTRAFPSPSGGLAVLIDHDDAEREFAYESKAVSFDEDRPITQVVGELGWTVVSMANDWETVFGLAAHAAVRMVDSERPGRMPE